MKSLKKNKSTTLDLTEGSIIKGIMSFAIPLFIGQLLQQMYNLADAWVVGNYADNAAFAAVSSSGNVLWLITGFCSGLATGGGVIISKYFGAKDPENVSRAVHTNVLMGLIASVLSTVVSLILTPFLLGWMKIPDSVLPSSRTYFTIYFAGITTVIMYNIFMSIMRALGDSVRPLYYLAVSSVLNVVLDLILVAGFHTGVAGAALATVFSQGVAALMCLIRMMKADDESHIELKKLKYHASIMRDVMYQGLPTAIQGSVISIGNMVIQANINSFGAYAMSGQGAYAKIEGFAFLPVTCMAMTLPTFVSQNLGAGKLKRAKSGSYIGLVIGVLTAEFIGVLVHFFAPALLGLFISSEEAIAYGMRNAAIQPLFYFVLSFSHVAAGVLRGYQKAVIPMFAMLACWCVIRIIYVTVTLHFIPVYDVIAWAYPLTWTLTTIIFIVSLIKTFREYREQSAFSPNV